MAKSWERNAKKTGESATAYTLFLAYRDLGEARTFPKVQEACKKRDRKPYSHSHIGQLASRHFWTARCTDWDNHLQRERDKVAAKQAATWEQRRLDSREAEWTDAQVLREKFLGFMKFPLSSVEKSSTETSVDGKTITINTTVIEPARYTGRDMALIRRLIGDMEAHALGIEKQVQADEDETQRSLTTEAVAAARAAAVKVMGVVDEEE